MPSPAENQDEAFAGLPASQLLSAIVESSDDATIRVRKDGTPLHVSLTISPIKDAAGKVVGASKVARDISKEQTLLAELAHANGELKRADRMKSEFLAVMSHELRTPLNSIIGFAAVLRQGRAGPLTDEQKKQLNLIHASGKHLLHLINDLLDLSRIEAGRMDVEREDFAIEDVIQEAVRTLELQVAQKRLQIQQHLTFEGPVHSDRKRVFQVLLNLLNNAIKFTPAGSIAISARREGNDLVVSLTDTGIGIAKEKQAGLFTAFSQIEGSSRRRYEGTGLGLYSNGSQTIRPTPAPASASPSSVAEWNEWAAPSESNRRRAWAAAFGSSCRQLVKVQARRPRSKIALSRSRLRATRFSRVSATTIKSFRRRPPAPLHARR